MQVELRPEERDLLSLIVRRFDQADKGLHRRSREQWDHLDGLWNNYDDAKRANASNAPRDRDPGLTDLRAQFGHDLFIPHSFATVELAVARTLANAPRMLWMPKNAPSSEHTEAVAALFDQQQGRIDYPLVLQSVGKSGHLYNIGVQKTLWRKQEREAKRNKFVGGEWTTVNPVLQTIFDGPVAEYVSPYNFIWDPYATSMADCGWVVHRSWRPTSYVLARLGLNPELPADKTPWPALYGRIDAETVEGLGSRSKWSEVMSGRLENQGDRGDPKPAEGENIHEVWEYHDGEQVAVVLDRELPVALGDNPNWKGGIPFQIYRPSWAPDRFLGKGTVEPIEDLQHESSMMRTNRMWNALLKLHASYAYNDGVVDPDDIRIGPGTLVPVNGDPSGLLQELTVGDIPASSYRETEELLNDILRASGQSDPVEQISGGETATGVQLAQAATMVRVAMQTRRVELELAKPAAREFLQLNKQRVIEAIEVPLPASPSGEDPEREWRWLSVGPEQLNGTGDIEHDWDVEPEGGTTAAENVPQMRADGDKFLQLSGDPRVDGRKMFGLALRSYGVRHPDQYLAAEQPQVDPDLVYKSLIDQGVPENQARAAVGTAVQAKQTQLEQERSGGGG